MGDLQKFLSTAPVLIMALLTFTAGILIEFNRFYPDLLFHPLVKLKFTSTKVSLTYNRIYLSAKLLRIYISLAAINLVISRSFS